MSNDWSPDEDEGTETFEQDDEAFDESDRLDPNFLEDMEIDPSLEASRQVDDLELDEIGAEFDDPEQMATLDGGIDDPDGLNDASLIRSKPDPEEDGWDLDAER